MENIDCLNCDTNFTGNYCPNCAQRASTRRYSWGYVFSKDFVAENFNFDRGFLLTLLHLSYRPGHLVNDYLQGKRKKYFNALALLLVVLAIEAIIWSLSYNSIAQVLTDTINDQLAVTGPENFEKLRLEDAEIMLAYQKAIFLFAVPSAAFFSWLIFKRLGYNFLEHCIAIIFLLAMNTYLGFGMGLLSIAHMPMSTFKMFYASFSFIVIVFDLLLIWQFSTKAIYSFGGRTWRVLLALTIILGVIGLSQQFALGVSKGFHGAKTIDQTEMME